MQDESLLDSLYAAWESGGPWAENDPQRQARTGLIAVAGAYGGCGATTVALHLALWLDSKQTCALVNAAPGTDAAGEHPGLAELRARFAAVVVDLSARHDDVARQVLESADRIVLVTEADMAALWRAIGRRRQLGPELPVGLVLNRFRPRPELDLTAVEEVMKAPVLWKAPEVPARRMPLAPRETAGLSELAAENRAAARNKPGWGRWPFRPGEEG